MPRDSLGISTLASYGPLISRIWDGTGRSSGNSGVGTGQLCSLGRSAV